MIDRQEAREPRPGAKNISFLHFLPVIIKGFLGPGTFENTKDILSVVIQLICLVKTDGKALMNLMMKSIAKGSRLFFILFI